MRLLLVDDDIKIAQFVVNGRREAGFAVDHAANGEDGLHLALTEPYDVAVVDLMLPKLDGLTLIEEVRRKNIDTPVLILSAKRSVDDRVKGLKTGSDDYLVKPFAFSELLARVQALIRRSTCVTAPSELKVADLTLDFHARKVFRADGEIFLQPLEFSLLEYLMRNAGRYFPLVVGNRWVYQGDTDEGTEVITVKVLNETKEIEYPEDSGNTFICRVVRDIVELNGVVIEDTDDWYAQATNGDIWYFGEISQVFEDGELVELEGSWKAGKEGAHPGILIQNDLQPENIYRQEYWLAEAEDVAEVINRDDETVTVGGVTYDDDVLKTKDFTPISLFSRP